MTCSFNKTFGINQQNIHAHCVLVPFLTRSMLQQFGVDTLQQGFPFSSANCSAYSLIQTRIGATYVGDAILQLQSSPAKNIIFMGTCGLCETHNCQIGDIIIPEKVFCQDSFTGMLKGDLTWKQCFSPNASLFKRIQHLKVQENIFFHPTASVASIALENHMPTCLDTDQIAAFDLEAAACLAAAQHIGRPALVILVATDHIHKEEERHHSRLISCPDIQKGMHDAINLIQILLRALKN